MSVRGKIKKSRPGEALSLKSPLVQGILAQASHYSLKRVYQKNLMAQVLHISPRRDMFSLGEILCSFGKLWFCHFSNFCSTSHTQFMILWVQITHKHTPNHNSINSLSFHKVSHQQTPNQAFKLNFHNLAKTRQFLAFDDLNSGTKTHSHA